MSRFHRHSVPHSVLFPSESSLHDGLVAYWGLGGATGQSRVDSGPNGHDLIAIGGDDVLQAVGLIGGASEFDSSVSERTIGRANALAGDLIPSADFSMAGWVFSNDLTNKQEFAGVYGSAPNRSHKVYKAATAGGVLEFLVSRDGTNGSTLSSSYAPTVSTWTFWYVQHVDGATIGIRVGSGSTLNAIETQAHTTGVYGASTSDFSLGAVETPNRLNGRVDEVGFWNRVLTDAEQVELFNNGVGLAYPFEN